MSDSAVRILATVALASTTAMPALANEQPVAAAQPAASGDDVRPGEISVSVGRALDLVGPNRYADRTAVSTTGATVRFSDRPVIAYTPSRSGSALGSPLAYSRKSSSFGYRYHPISGGWRMHSGVDLAAAQYSPVRASGSGVVRRAGWAGGYGLLVELDHGGGVTTRYGHLSRLDVSAGQQVAAGQSVGLVGSTGNSTGPHLHYEKRVGGVAVNPGI